MSISLILPSDHHLLAALAALPFLILCATWLTYGLTAWLLTPRKAIARSPYGRGARIHAPVEITRITRHGGGF
jgi:hypothetical protein